MGNRFNADMGAGMGRGGSPYDTLSAPANSRGGVGAETGGVAASNLSGNVHSARGFKRALEKTQSRSNRLAGQLPQKSNFGGPKFNKPNYFAQGGGRHGMHIGSGAPFTGAAEREGVDV